MSAFHEVALPLPFALGASGGPERRVDIVTLGSGREVRNTPWAHGRRRYDIGGAVRTLDELFELLTLRQTKKARTIPIVLFDEAYWRSIVNFDALVEHGMVAADDLNLFRFAESAEAVWAALIEQNLAIPSADEEDLARDM